MCFDLDLIFPGDTPAGSLPTKGRFGHSAVVVNGNIMFVVGGYSGQVLGSLLAYKVPSAIADFEVILYDMWKYFWNKWI